MPDTVTPVLGLVKPEINGEATENVWGFDLNDNFDKIDVRFSILPASDAPLDGNIYARRMGAWQTTVMSSDFETLVDLVDDERARNDAQDTALAGKADSVHTHVAADITDLAETIDDQVANVLVAGPNVLLQYDDELGKLQISATGGGGEGGGGAGPPPNGDYGDIIVTGFGVTWTIDNGVVTYQKMQNVGADSLLGNSTVIPGRAQEIPCTAAGRALLDDADAAAQRATLGLSSMATEDAANFQAKDATLTALAAMTGGGLVEQTGVDVFLKRQIGISAPESLPTFGDTEVRYQAKDPTLTAFSYLGAGPGIIEVTGQDFFAIRDIGVATATSIPDRAAADARYATLASPVFTGDARCVTPATTDNDTSIATTAFVKAAAVNKAGDTMTGNLAITGGISATFGSFTGTVTGVASTWSGDMTVYRANSPGTGVIFLGNSGARYLYWDGTNYGLPGGGMSVGGGISATTGTFSSNISANIVTGNAINSNGNSSIAGTAYLGALSTATGAITNLNGSNFAASNNITCNNGDVAGQWRTGSIHNYGGLNSGYATIAGIQCNGDINGSNSCIITGPCYAGGFFPTGSDKRLKENLVPIENSGAIIDATEVWGFRWKTTGKDDFGVMAQDVQPILPSVVYFNEEKDLWGVDYAKYVPFLIRELQLMRLRVADTEEQIDILHQRIKDLEAPSGRASH